MFQPGNGFVEVKGTQKKIGLTDVREIFRSGTRDGLITCGRLTPKAKEYLNRGGKHFIENVPLDEVMDYNILQERT